MMFSRKKNLCCKTLKGFYQEAVGCCQKVDVVGERSGKPKQPQKHDIHVRPILENEGQRFGS
jgi:hypothetical protein